MSTGTEVLDWLRSKNTNGTQLSPTQLSEFTSELGARLNTVSIEVPEARMGGYGVCLLRAFEQRATNRHVTEITLGVNSGIDTEKLAGFVARVGYRKVGENFVKEAGA